MSQTTASGDEAIQLFTLGAREEPETATFGGESVSAGAYGRRSLLNTAAMLGADALAVWLALATATSLFMSAGRSAENGAWWTLAWTAPWLAAAFAARAYPGYGLDSAERLRRTAIACAAACPSLMAAQLASGAAPLAILLCVTTAAGLAVPLSLLLRGAARGALARFGAWGVPAVVIGKGAAALALLNTLSANAELGYRPVEAGAADLAIVAMPNLSETQRGRLLEGPLASFRRVLFVVSSPAHDAGWVGARHLGSLSALELRRRHLEAGDLRVKRALDLALALLLLPLLLPLTLLIGLAIRLDSPGPLLYGAHRMGWRGRPFRCWKFRSMYPDAEVRLTELLARDPEAREQYARYHKLHDDPRVTRVGRFLRHTSLDELPQIVNVLLGEMSLVGPRPYMPRERPDIEPYAGVVLSCRPGMTGWWQVSGRNAARFDERVLMDLDYVRRWSPWLDLLILASTVRVVLAGKGAF